MSLVSTSPTKAPALGEKIKYMGRTITTDEHGLVYVQSKGKPVSPAFPNISRAVDAIKFATGLI